VRFFQKYTNPNGGNKFRLKVARRLLLLCVILAITGRGLAVVASAPETGALITVSDDSGQWLKFTAPPQRVVCLSPTATEIIFALEADKALVGLTHHDGGLPGAAGRAVVGGFFSPDGRRVADLKPDLVIAAPRHREILARYLAATVPVLYLRAQTMADGFRHMELLGELFQCRPVAAVLAAENRAQLQLVARKVAKIPLEKRKRVLRFMRFSQDGERLQTPGSDSFQTELIRAAGGIAPDFGKTGAVVPVSLSEFREFDPEVIYGCGGDREAADSLLTRAGWQEVTAVREDRMLWFPCELTCRAGAHMGYFVSWLAARLYTAEFARAENELLRRRVTASRPLDLELDYVRRIEIVESTIHDFVNRSLLLEFSEPVSVVSTLEGQRDGIRVVGNHYSSAPCWPINHGLGLSALRRETFPVLGLNEADSSLLFTGADMNNLAIKWENYKDLKVCALVTAGVRGNALRMGRDTGFWYEPGTINMIILANAELSSRAMTRAIISATEAKSAVLQDLDVRSTPQPHLAATGTGTDNIIVVSGRGEIKLEATGGHSKMGELIARAVYAGVREAISKQNGLVGGRNIFLRLAERDLAIFHLVRQARPTAPLAARQKFAAGLELLLLEPANAGLLECALALADAQERGTVHDLSAFEAACRATAARIAGRPLAQLMPVFSANTLSEPISLALNALATGLEERGGSDGID